MTNVQSAAIFLFEFFHANSALLRWVLAALLVLAATVGTHWFRRLTGFIHRRLGDHTPEWLQILNDGFELPLLLMVRAGLLFLAVLAMPLPIAYATVWTVSFTLLKAVVAALVAWGLWRSASLTRLLLRSAQNHLDLDSNQTMVHFFEKIYRALIAVFTALIILDLFGVPVTGLVTGAGIAGLAVSLAAQSTLSNLLAGITLVMEHPFGIGDYITLGNVEGTVEEISFRSTRLRTADNAVLTLENSKVCAECIQNITDRTSRLWEFTICVKYNTSRAKIEALCADLTALLQEDPQIKPDEVQVVLAAFSASSIDLNARVYATAVSLSDFRALKNRLNLAILDLVAKDGCEFAFPSTSIYMEPAEK